MAMLRPTSLSSLLALRRISQSVACRSINTFASRTATPFATTSLHGASPVLFRATPLFLSSQLSSSPHNFRSIKLVPRAKDGPTPPSEEYLLPVTDPERLTLVVSSLENKPLAKIQLHPEVFGQPIRRDIVQRVILWQRALRRAGTNHSKNRAEVSGSGRKPHPQKGSGRARQGTKRSAPHQKGGAASMGPRTRSFAYKLNKQVRLLGLKIALSAKQREGNLLIVDEAVLESHKTKGLTQILGPRGFSHLLFIDYEPHPNFVLAARNIDFVNVLPAASANVYDIVRHRTLMITLSALRFLESRLLGTPMAAPYPLEKHALAAIEAGDQKPTEQSDA